MLDEKTIEAILAAGYGPCLFSCCSLLERRDLLGSHSVPPEIREVMLLIERARSDLRAGPSAPERRRLLVHQYCSETGVSEIAFRLLFDHLEEDICAEVRETQSASLSDAQAQSEMYLQAAILYFQHARVSEMLRCLDAAKIAQCAAEPYFADTVDRFWLTMQASYPCAQSRSARWQLTARFCDSLALAPCSKNVQSIWRKLFASMGYCVKEAIRWGSYSEAASYLEKINEYARVGSRPGAGDAINAWSDLVGPAGEEYLPLLKPLKALIESSYAGRANRLDECLFFCVATLLKVSEHDPALAARIWADLVGDPDIKSLTPSRLKEHLTETSDRFKDQFPGLADRLIESNHAAATLQQGNESSIERAILPPEEEKLARNRRRLRFNSWRCAFHDDVFRELKKIVSFTKPMRAECTVFPNMNFSCQLMLHGKIFQLSQDQEKLLQARVQELLRKHPPDREFFTSQLPNASSDEILITILLV